MSVSVWVVFTRLSRGGPVTKPQSCYGIATSDVDEAKSGKNKKRRIGDDAIDLTRENIQLVGYQPPFVVPNIKWRVNIRYSSQCEYDIPLGEHLQGRSHPAIKVVELDDGVIFSEFESMCGRDKDLPSFINNSIVSNSEVVPKNFKIQNVASIDDLKFEIRNSSMYAWIQHSAFLLKNCIEDVIKMCILYDSAFLYRCSISQGSKCIKEVKDDVKNIFKFSIGGHLRICDLTHDELTSASAEFSKIWHRKDFLWIDVFVAIKIYRGLHAYLKMQKNSCRGYFAGADLDAVCAFSRVDHEKITTRQRSMISEVLIVQNGNKVFTNEMYETANLINQMVQDCSTVFCVVHRGVSKYSTRFGTTCMACEDVRDGDIVADIKKTKFHKRIVFRNIHTLTTCNFKRLFKWIAENLKDGSVTFTFDPSGCYCNCYYNWCIGIFCKVFKSHPENISYHEDQDIYSLNQYTTVSCDKSNVLRRSWSKDGANATSELNVFWVKSSLDVEDEDDQKEGGVISRNNWVTHLCDGDESYSIVTSVGTKGANLKKYFRSGDMKTITGVPVHQLQKIHAIPGDILSAIKNDFSIDVMGIYAPHGIGAFSGWDIQNLLRCMAKAKKRIYVYSPDFQGFMCLVKGEIGGDKDATESSFQSRKSSFMQSELLTQDCIDSFLDIDPCLRLIVNQ